MHSSKYTLASVESDEDSITNSQTREGHPSALLQIKNDDAYFLKPIIASFCFSLLLMAVTGLALSSLRHDSLNDEHILPVNYRQMEETNNIQIQNTMGASHFTPMKEKIELKEEKSKLSDASLDGKERLIRIANEQKAQSSKLLGENLNEKALVRIGNEDKVQSVQKDTHKPSQSPSVAPTTSPTRLPTPDPTKAEETLSDETFTAIFESIDHIQNLKSVLQSLHSTEKSLLSQTPLDMIVSCGESHVFDVQSDQKEPLIAVAYSNETMLQADVDGSSIQFDFQISGNYEIFLIEVLLGKGSLSHQMFALSVHGNCPIVQKEMESCVEMEQTIDMLEGYWSFEPDNAGTKRTNGWIYLPNQCKLNFYDTSAIKKVDGKRTYWIEVLGSSQERGVFLTLVDMLVPKEIRGELRDSALWKCWGYMRVDYGHFRVAYNDFRVFSANFDTSPDEDSITCHNEKIAQNSRYQFAHNATVYLESLFEDRSHTPDIIIMPTLHEELLEYIPSWWNGKIILAFLYKKHFAPLRKQRREKEVADLKFPDERIRGIVMSSFGGIVPHTWEHMFSQHSHKACNIGNSSQTVCGYTAEVISQIILNYLRIEEATETEKIQPVEVQIDSKELLPFLILANPVGKTVRYIPSAESTPVWNGQFCPKDCIDQDPSEFISSEGSKNIEVRHCKLN